MKVLKVLIVICLICSISCRQQMPVRPGVGKLDISNKSIVLFSLKLHNKLKPECIPRVFQIKIADMERNGRGWEPVYPFAVGKDFVIYLFSADIEPGEYVLGYISGNIPIPRELLDTNEPTAASFAASVNGKFTIKEKEILYIGHVNMVNRKRESHEPRSGTGGYFQKAVGLVDGTFDITITDNSETDLYLYKRDYPCLKNEEVKIRIMKQLPPGDYCRR